MNQNYAFLDARARQAEAEAQEATLANVRERALRSAASWRTMADRALKLESDRARAEDDRISRRLAEAEADASADPDGSERAPDGALAWDQRQG